MAQATPAKTLVTGLPTPPNSGSKASSMAVKSVDTPSLSFSPSLDVKEGDFFSLNASQFTTDPAPMTPPASPRHCPSPFPWLTSSPLSRSGSSSKRSDDDITPSLSPSSAFSRLSLGAPVTPSGYEHLDFGADYFTTGHKVRRDPRSFEWEWWSSKEYSGEGELAGGLFAPQADVLKRRLGPNEVSYYLSSRGNGPDDALAGVNDMYLHIGFSAPARLVTRERVLSIWTEMRLRHTLLASRVEFQGYEDIRFVHSPPETLEQAFAGAALSSESIYSTPRNDVLDGYLNGPRTLSDDLLAKLIVSSPVAQLDEESEEVVEFDFWLFATHFLGDGMALHTFSNTFFALLGGKMEALVEEGQAQWAADGSVPAPPLGRLSPAMESRISSPASWGRLAWAAARVEFQRNQGQLIGGQTFPRRKLGERKTVVPTISFTAAETSAILKKCKANGCTVAHAVFALSNLAHIRVVDADARSERPQWSAKARDRSLPTMLYSALNLRPNLVVPDEIKASGTTPDFFHLVIGYYNVILPSFRPTGLSDAQTFWHRARSTKEQSLAATKSKWLTPRSKLMSLDRERRSIGFERAADLKRRPAPPAGGAMSFGLGLDVGAAPPPSVPEPVPELKKTAAPSLALLGVSMLGNLDGMYKHADFPSIQLHTLTTGSRQRPGGMLLFAYTFAGKLWFSLGYDANGFEVGTVERFWQAVQDGAREFLLDEAPKPVIA